MKPNPDGKWTDERVREPIDLWARKTLAWWQKKRVTWAFFVTASGEKDAPIVVRRSSGFKSLKDNSRLCKCDYFSSSKAWVASEIFAEILSDGPRGSPHTTVSCQCTLSLQLAYRPLLEYEDGFSVDKKDNFSHTTLDAGIIKLRKVLLIKKQNNSIHWCFTIFTRLNTTRGILEAEVAILDCIV